MRPRSSWVRAGIVALVVALAGCGGGEVPGPVAVGLPAPAYAGTTLDGDSVSLVGLRGRPVLLNVWATWCGPCREEMPGLQALQEEYGGRGLRVVGVSIDGAGADGDVRDFVREHGIGFTILRDPDERFTRTFRTVGVPETLLIDGEGKVAARWIGQFDPASADARAKIEQAMTTVAGR